MTIKDMRIGLRVRWNDPDGGKCSCVGTVVSFCEEDEVVLMKKADGVEVEVYSRELELVKNKKGESGMKINDPTLEKDGKRHITSITIDSDGIDYYFGDETMRCRIFAKTRQDLERMNNGEIIRYQRGTGVGYHQINEPQDCVFVVQSCWSEERPDIDKGQYYDKIVVNFTDSYKTLKKAFDSFLDPVDSMWDGSCLQIKDVTGLSIDGMDNYDVATYLVTEDGELSYLVRCQFVGDREELIEGALKKMSENDECYPADYRDEAIRRAKALGVPIDDRRKKG